MDQSDHSVIIMDQPDNPVILFMGYKEYLPEIILASF